MQKKFIVNLAFLLLLNLLVKPFYILGIDAEILKQVEGSSPGSYGEYFSLIGLTFILNIFLDFGIINYNTRNIAQNQQLLSKHFSGIISIRLVLSFFYILFIGITGFALGYGPSQFKLLSILATNQILVAFILYFRSNLTGLLLFKQDSIISVLDRLLLIGICSFLLWGRATNQPFKIEWFVYAQTISYGFTALFAGWLVLRKTGWFKPKFDKAFTLMIFKQSIPYALLILLMMIYYRSDSVMLERILPNGARESALYAQGFRFFEAFNMIGYLFAGLLLPIFARMLKEKKEVSGMVYLSLKLILSGAMIIGIAGFLFSSDLIHWRYGNTGDELVRSSQAFSMLMLCFISICITYIFGTLLTANGNLKILNWLAFTGVIMNIGLNFYLIPLHGAYGAALASVITQGITAIGQIILAFVEIKIEIDKRSLLQFFIFCILLGPAIYMNTYLETEWVWKLIIFVITGSTLALVTGMISIKGLINILKSEQ